MNLEHHVGVLWRHRTIAIGSVLLGGFLALMAAYDLPSLERRGSESWSVQSHILVTQPGFPEGRITLSTPGGGNVPGGGTAPQGNDQPFADPARLSSLALLYAVIADSDRVRSRLPGNPAPNQLEATALDATGNGTTFLPIMQLTTTADNADEARRLNVAGYETFKGVLESTQEANAIPPKGRVRLSILNHPSNPLMISGPSLAPSIIAFLLCCLGGLAAAHILEALSLRRVRADEATGPQPAHAGSEPAPEPPELTPLTHSGRLRR